MQPELIDADTIVDPIPTPSVPGANGVPADTTSSQDAPEPPPPPLSAVERLARAQQQREAEAQRVRIAALAKYQTLIRRGELDSTADEVVQQLADELNLTPATIAGDVDAWVEATNISQQQPEIEKQIIAAEQEAVAALERHNVAPLEAQRHIADAMAALQTANSRLNRLREAKRAGEGRQRDLLKKHARIFD